MRDYPITSVWIEIDTDKMTQVIDNILNNAIKYSPDGGKITVTMKTTDDQMILSISDQGLGIPKQDLPRIFDRFYRDGSCQKSCPRWYGSRTSNC